jgi:hypothetical protein
MTTHDDMKTTHSANLTVLFFHGGHGFAADFRAACGDEVADDWLAAARAVGVRRLPGRAETFDAAGINPRMASK